jgi:Ca2+-binding RTX toxin-like protein
VKLRSLSTFTLSIFSSILLLSILNGSTIFLNNTWGDDITGTVNNDNLRGTINSDILIGLAGNDKLYGSSVVVVLISSKEAKARIILTVVKVLTKFWTTVHNKGTLEEAIAKITNQEIRRRNDQ